MKLSHWEPDLRTLFNWIENGEIDLQPNFQRGDVWPITKKRKLIDTILREWSIPPIHVVVTSTGTLEVLDGQQRLTAIRDFMNNEFSIDGTIEPIDDRIEPLAGFRYSELPTLVRRTFDQYTLRVFRITDYKPEEPGELFYRLNQQITLTAGEQRNAIFGPAREQLKGIVSEFEMRGNKRETIGFSNSRLAYDDVFAKVLFFIEHKSFAEKATENRISDRFKLQSPFSEMAINRTHNAIEMFSDGRAAAQKVKLNKATLLSWLLFFCRFERPAPIEFLSLFEDAKLRRLDDALSTITGQPVASHKGTAFEHDLVNLFVDRSSLRVSDVSSVVYRDFALWAIYKTSGIGYIPANLKVSEIDYIEHLLKERPDVSLEAALDSHLNLRGWARL